MPADRKTEEKEEKRGKKGNFREDNRTKKLQGVSGDEVFWGERMKDPSEVTGSPQKPTTFSSLDRKPGHPCNLEVICFGSPQPPRITH